jgi:hypothetical protein
MCVCAHVGVTCAFVCVRVCTQFYAQMKQAGKPFEVIFMSCDRDPKSFADYLSHMPVSFFCFLFKPEPRTLNPKSFADCLSHMPVLNPKL